jgi:hypothetical protein
LRSFREHSVDANQTALESQANFGVKFGGQVLHFSVLRGVDR